MLFLRSLVFNVYFYVLTVTMAVLWLPSLVLPSGVFFFGLRRWCWLVNGGLRRICNVEIEIRGRERVPDGPVLIASKHQSTWDIIIFNGLLDSPAIVMKRELMFIPVFGWLAAAGGMVAVDRKGHAKAMRKMLADARDRAAQGRPIVIFPQGTRVAPGAWHDYRPGVAAIYNALDIPCVPVAVRSGIVWPRRKFLRHPGTIVLEFLEPIAPGTHRKKFLPLLTERIERASNALLEEVGHPTASIPEAAKAA